MIRVEDYVSKKEYSDIKNLVMSRLTDTSYEGGQLEDLGHLADDIVNAFGIMLTVLYEKKVLNLRQVLRILDGYISDSTTIEQYSGEVEARKRTKQETNKLRTKLKKKRRRRVRRTK